MAEPQHDPLKPASPLPSKVGDYEILCEIGRGGMGVIYKARQCGLNRLCAVKMLHGSGPAGPEDPESLKTEAQAAASLDHPNIVGIYEFSDEHGQWYFSMEYIEGEELGRYALSNLLDATTVATLAKKICDALVYAHSRGVMHHDLKPPNVLIDSSGEPQITDFGLARRVDEARRNDPARGAGSPNFMSPEQASARFGEPGIQTDVFGLGALLYFLLTSRPPFRGETTDDTIRAVLTLEPVQPRMLRPGVPPDLETICLKCLQKQPAKRYATMQELSDELGRFLSDEPIHARPAGPVERGRKWCRRHPAIAVMGAVIALLILAVVFGSGMTAYRVNQARQRAETSESAARRDLYAADMLLASQAFASGNDSKVHDILARQKPGPTGEDPRGWEWRFLWQATEGDRKAIVGKHKAAVAQMELMPDGKTVVAADSSGTLKVWDLEKHLELASQQIRQVGAPRFNLAHHTNSLIATRMDAAASNCVVLILSLPTLAPLRQFTAAQPVLCGAFEPDDSKVWLIGANFVSRHDAVTGTELVRHAIDWKGAGRDFAFSHDCRLLAYGHDSGQITILNLGTGFISGSFAAHVFRPVWGASINWLTFSQDDRFLASCGSDGAARVWDVESRQLYREISGHADLVMGAGFSTDAARLISAGKDSFLQIKELRQTNPPLQLRGARALQTTAVFMPDGRTPLTGGLDGEITLWNPVHRPALQWITNLPPETTGISILEGGEYFATLENDYSGNIHRVQDGKIILRLPGATNQMASIVQHLGGGTFISAAMDNFGKITVRTDPTGVQYVLQSGPPSSPHGPTLLSGGISPDGKMLAVADFAQGTKVYDLTKRALKRRYDLKPRSLAISKNGRWMAAGEVSGRIHLFDLNSDAEPPFPASHLQLSNLPDGSERLTLTTTAGNLFSIAWLPDGSRIFGGSLSGAITVWDVATRRETFVYQAHRQPVMGIAVLPDGTLISSGPDGVCKWPITRDLPK